MNGHVDLRPDNGTKRCATAPKLQSSNPIIASMPLQSDEPIDDLLSRSDSRVSASLIAGLAGAARPDRNGVPQLKGTMSMMSPASCKRA